MRPLDGDNVNWRSVYYVVSYIDRACCNQRTRCSKAEVSYFYMVVRVQEDIYWLRDKMKLSFAKA